MRSIAVFFSVLSFSYSSLFGLNVEAYHSHSSIQWTWAVIALDKLDIKNEAHILDIGSGDGKISALLAKKASSGYVTGLEPNIHALKFAEEHYSLPNLSFVQGKIEEIKDSNAYDYATAFCSLNWVDDVAASLSCISKALRSGGEVLIVLPASPDPSIRERFASFFDDPRWKPFLHLFKHQKAYNLEEYAQMLHETSLDPTSLETIKTAAVFHDSCEMRNWLLAIRPEWDQIPEELLNEYFIFHEAILKEIFPQAGDGRLYAFPKMLCIHAKKR